MDAANIHGTAIVVGKVGLLFLGPSGIGKSALAFACLASARPLGLHASLVADDRVLLSRVESGILAECPPSIAGLMEIRGTGIVKMAYTSSAPIHYAVLPADPANAVRLPDDDEWADVADGIRLPVVRLLTTSINPLAIIMAKIPAQFE